MPGFAPTVAVNAPKTPVTTTSLGSATATLPNVCKMPPPVPLPNIGLSGKLPLGYSITVQVEGAPVAIRGASFGSEGDVASRLTGGGVISQNTQGPTRFVGPGSLDVRIEGRNVHLLGDATLNNCDPLLGSRPNAATLPGIVQAPLPV